MNKLNPIKPFPLLLMLGLLVRLTSGHAQTGKNYYLSNSGSDSNTGTKDAPWKTLDKLSATSLNPGDSVLFRRGDRFDGHYVVNGSGEKGTPIVIAAYGDGEKPIITGEVGASGGGDYREAILVQNEDNLVFDGLEIQNERLTTRPGVRDMDAFGIWLHNTEGVMENFVFQNMTFRDVYAVEPILDRSSFDAIQVSGLRLTSTKNTVNGQEKQIKNVEVKDSFFGNLQRFGIQLRHSRGAAGVGNDSLNRIMNVHIHHNEFSYNGGTGVLPNGTYNCLIEYNLFDHPGSDNDPRMPARGSSIWNIWSINTVSQYNMCISTRGYLDSYGIHIDNHNVNTFVQYNYMEDCEGGFVEILRGNKNAVYRFNVSVNDGFRYNENWKTSNHTIWVHTVRHKPEDFAPNDSVFIHNNTVVINKPYTSGITETSVVVDSDNLYIFNNIFTSTDGGVEVAGHMGKSPASRGDKMVVRNNLFQGNVNQEFVQWDASPVSGDPKFLGEGDRENAFQLSPSSPALNAGTGGILGPVLPGAGKGVFKELTPYPTVDFFGNPIDLSDANVNIGAYNGKGASDEIEPPLNVEKNRENWRIYPVSTSSQLSILKPTGVRGEVSISLLNLKGQRVQSQTLNFTKKEPATLKLRKGLKNGIYILKLEQNQEVATRRIVLYR